MAKSEPSWLSAADTARLVRSKALSPVEAVQAAIDRIETRNPSLNAVIYKDYEGALAQARALEARIMAGEQVGPLAGVPSLAKDLFEFKEGWPSTLGGTPALRDYRPDFTSGPIAAMERSDAILLGKTNSSTLGFSGTTDNVLFGPTCNPFNIEYNSGGSSGGTAAAVADGIVPISGASDGAGSIRIPAAWCGVVGYQPSYGLVPMATRPNGFGNTAAFVYAGHSARTVEDAALGMSVLAEYDPRDPFSAKTNIDFRAAIDRTVSGLRIGFTSNFGIFPVIAPVLEQVQQTAQALVEAGANLDDAGISLNHSSAELSTMLARQLCGGVIGLFEGLRAAGIDLVGDHQEDLPERFLRIMTDAKQQSVIERQHDEMMRTTVLDAIESAFETFDLIIAPTVAVPAVKNSSEGIVTGPSIVDGQSVDPLIGWCLTYLTNMTGHPSISVPAGLVDGLPVGMMIIGKRFADADVLAAAAAVERVRPWTKLYDIPAARCLD